MGQIEKKEKVQIEKGTPSPSRTGGALLPSRLMDRLEHMMERWEPWGLSWPRWPEEMPTRVPALNLYEEGDTLVVETELPGMRKEEIEITLSGDVLTISGKREQEKKEERRDYFRMERSTSAVSRTIQLPAEVKPDQMTAELKDGVLTIRAPRSETTRASVRKVPVT